MTRTDSRSTQRSVTSRSGEVKYMRNDEEICKAGDWTITHSLHIGDNEVVFGEDKESVETPYMCGFCQANGLFRLHRRGRLS